MLFSAFAVLVIFLLMCAFWPHLKDLAVTILGYIAAAFGLKGNEDRMNKRPIFPDPVREEKPERAERATPEAEAERPELAPTVYHAEDADETVQGSTIEEPPKPDEDDQVSRKAVDLILEFEGLDQPSLWPGGASGITLGHGYDLGYQRGFRDHWRGVLDDDDIDALSSAVNVRGAAARAMAPRFRGIRISVQQARQVFERVTIPQQVAIAKEFIGPHFGDLPPDCFGAIVSLVFNRGAAVSGTNREEMRQVRDALRAGPDSWYRIPGMIRAMVRIWKGKPIERGMTRRRNAEAALFEQGLGKA